MTKRKEDDDEMIRVHTMLGKQPLRDRVRKYVMEKGLTPEALATAMDYSPRIVTAYLSGVMKIPVSAFLRIAEQLALDQPTLIRMWLTENAPEILEVLDALPAPPLLSETERRMIRHLRSYTDRGECELIVADGSDLVALLMAR